MSGAIETISSERADVMRAVADKVGTPAYVYFRGDIEAGLRTFQAIPAPDGVTVRFAAKANTTAGILKVLDNAGAHFDASTYNEALRVADGPARIDGKKVRLTSQEVQTPEKLDHLSELGVLYTASSLRQLDTYGRRHPGSEVGVRFNVGIGSGWNAQNTTGGENSSFGIYGQRDEIDRLLAEHDLTLSTVHLHIGSGSNPDKQKEAMSAGLDLVRQYGTVTHLDMGGGFKVARMSHETSTDVSEMGVAMGQALQDFEAETGRSIKLEVEPGTALVANAGFIVTEVVDKVTTGKHDFLKVDGGMSTNARPVMYGAEHPLYVVSRQGANSDELADYLVAGINCESGDMLTVAPGDADRIAPRLMQRAEVGDLLVVGGAGGYTASMSPDHYNSQTSAPEVLVQHDGSLTVIRKRETLSDLWRYESVDGV